MTWVPLFLIFFTSCTVSMAQEGLIQQSSITRSPGQTVTLSCTGNNDNVGYLGAVWIQQHPDHTPRSVMARNNNRPSGISDRFSGSREGSVASLTISGLRPEDEAHYYCTAWDRSLSACTVLQRSEEVRQKPTSFAGSQQLMGNIQKSLNLNNEQTKAGLKRK